MNEYFMEFDKVPKEVLDQYGDSYEESSIRDLLTSNMPEIIKFMRWMENPNYPNRPMGIIVWSDNYVGVSYNFLGSLVLAVVEKDPRP